MRAHMESKQWWSETRLRAIPPDEPRIETTLSRPRLIAADSAQLQSFRTKYVLN